MQIGNRYCASKVAEWADCSDAYAQMDNRGGAGSELG